MNKEKKGILFTIIAAVISGISIPLNKVFVVDLDPLVFTAIRSLFVGFMFFLISFLRHETFKRANIKYLILIAIVGGSFAFFLFFSGLKLTTSGRAAFLHKTLPIYAIIFAFLLLKERITKKHIYSLLITLIGVLVLYNSEIISAQLWLNPSLGDLLVLIATVFWALENVISKKVMTKGENNLVVSFFRMFFGGIILFASVLLMGRYDTLMGLSTQQTINTVISSLILFGYVFFWYWGLKLIDVSKASTLLLLSPVISLVLGAVILSEPVPFSQAIGSVLILLGVYSVSIIRPTK